MFRNREFRKFAILFLLITILTVALGFAISTMTGILSIVSATTFGTAFFVFTKNRYKSIAQISEQINLVLHNANHLYITESDEGELSIL
ncbi:TPA: sensor histidine kinase, partial [Clostridioides difficile]|nr:sensor histidine kinase [Clostridioides difficile]